jgi:hypothetical protein
MSTHVYVLQLFRDGKKIIQPKKFHSLGSNSWNFLADSSNLLFAFKGR